MTLGEFISKSRAALTGWLWALVLVTGSRAQEAPAGPSPAPTPSATPFAGVLQFLDGSVLHGSLELVDPARGIRWRHPDAKAPIDFRPDNISGIHFDKIVPAGSQAPYRCRFRFKNGDELFGNLLALDHENIELESWLGGHLRTSRSRVESIMFLAKGYSVLYEGPADLEGWVQGQGQKPWQYRDGALVANGVGLLGRNLKMTGSTSLEMDLEWTGNFSLVLILYTDTLNRFDYGVNTYMFYLGPGYMSAQKIQANSGINQLGPQAQLPVSLKKNKMHFELRSSKEDASFTAIVDGKPLQTWRDPAGFIASGQGIVFFSQMDGPSVRLSNIRVAEWDGRADLEQGTADRGAGDYLRLANHDRVQGALGVLSDGKIGFEAAQTKLQVPVERVTQIYFGGTNQVAMGRTPWETRTFLAGGGNVSLTLEKWDEHQVSGRSANFGPLSFNSQSVRQIYFNLARQAENEANVNEKLAE
ncbi:MAG TPA: hypothetical protein VHH73_18095 [Verrucomicrobiae bacterium]|nr:hypothetical protein [Verrucomicrobiae bacterium]